MRQIALLDIIEVAVALGLPVRGNRAAASYRGSHDFNIALNRAKGCWHDFTTNQGGGIRRLVEIALGCDRRTALQWLADRFGVDIGGARSATERRDYARRLDRARVIAEKLMARRDDELAEIHEQKRFHLGEYHRLAAEAEARWRAGDDSLAWQVGAHWAALAQLDKRMDVLKNASAPELLQLFTESEAA